MRRLSCFYGHVPSHKQKKPASPSFEDMVKMLQHGSASHDASSNSNDQTVLQKLPMVENEADNLSNGAEHVTLRPLGRKSGDLKLECHTVSGADSVDCVMGNFKRSLSLGCELDQKGRIYDDNKSDACVDQGFSGDDSNDCNESGKLLAASDQRSTSTTLADQDDEAFLPVSSHLSSSMLNHESNFSVRDSHFSDKGDHGDSVAPLHTECSDDYGGQTNRIPSMISKSYSMPNFELCSPTAPLYFHIRNRSFEDLKFLATERGNAFAPATCGPGITKLDKDDESCKIETFDAEDAIQDGFDYYNYAYSGKDWIVPGGPEMGMLKLEQAESSCHLSDDFPNVDFKIKRIENWVTDLQHCSSVEETDEIADSCTETMTASGFIDGEDAAKVVTNINPGMEAAKKYISYLNASASTAHLANHGLVVVPLLSAFVGLKVLNLSGNFIVRITAGAFPRGLHMLNLSKNKISTIEGLKELTRLRVLDLSYNKIFRIGHGLASCSSLKELYLAGNKISEVEGFHRLLKLSVLDLRFNKIATAKCLGQLAANYNSLQAISLEGNPAQKNVGDEQLKKNLQGLLPHLAYYNRQHIKTSTLKDSSDRSVRLGISGHQFDRGLRSDHKSSRRGSFGGSALKRSALSSNHGQKAPTTESATTKQSRGRHGLGGNGSGTRTSHHHQFDMVNKIQSLKAGLSIPKSRSVGTLVEL